MKSAQAKPPTRPERILDLARAIARLCWDHSATAQDSGLGQDEIWAAFQLVRELLPHSRWFRTTQMVYLNPGENLDWVVGAEPAPPVIYAKRKAAKKKPLKKAAA